MSCCPTPVKLEALPPKRRSKAFPCSSSSFRTGSPRGYKTQKLPLTSLLESRSLEATSTLRGIYNAVEEGKQLKRALITGITGQDGSHLAEHLLGLGYEVHGLVRRVAFIWSSIQNPFSSGTCARSQATAVRRRAMGRTRSSMLRSWLSRSSQARALLTSI